jgi:hypothetical protein
MPREVWQILLFVLMVLIWIAVDQARRVSRARIQNARNRKQSGKEIS